MARVLVVDDEVRVVDFVKRGLRADGFQVEAAYDGGQCLEMAAQHDFDFDLVILDLRLPKVDGVTVLHRLLQERPDLRVLILSALSAVDRKVECLDLGASDYLAKPFALSELTARVRARLRQPASPVLPPKLSFGRLVLDPLRHRADIGEGSVRLTDTEFMLLRHLASHAGEVCSRDDLLAAVWNYAFDPHSNGLEVYVGRLRSKLSPDLIVTVRNVGYLLDPP